MGRSSSSARSPARIGPPWRCSMSAPRIRRAEEIRSAARLIRETGVDINFHGFVEGDDISKGTVDVVVTDGFTGNIALKTGEGTARLVAQLLREALTSGVLAQLKP
ncbi:MAG: hypothetical protein R3C16_00460 [Hyphomonadaceae bacterium]